MATTASPPLSKAKKTPATRVIVKYDCGFLNFLSIRGSSPNLSWKKGIPLKNLGPNEWFFECETPNSPCEFKILINDELYECGENHILLPSEINYITPHF